MIVFCILWVPFVYMLRRSIIGKGGSSGGVWALILGSIYAIVQFFLGNIISPGGFGFSRLLFGFVDLVCVPVLVPLLVYFFIFLFRGFSGDADFGGFALLWLIPAGALRALSWSAFNDPILLVAVPLLWTAIAAGISYFIDWIISTRYIILKIVFAFCILIPPAAASVSYWVLFHQQTLLGYGLLIFANIPFILSLVFQRRYFY